MLFPAVPAPPPPAFAYPTEEKDEERAGGAEGEGVNSSGERLLVEAAAKEVDWLVMRAGCGAVVGSKIHRNEP